jgi:hypothetical protein
MIDLDSPMEAPRASETAPPRLFRKVTAKSVRANMELIDYLVQEKSMKLGRPFTDQEESEFRLALIRKLAIQNDVQGAIDLQVGKQQG